jgi:hypothetical protein
MRLKRPYSTALLSLIKDCGSRPALAKSLQHPTSINKPGVVEDIERRIVVQADPDKNKRPYLKNN